MNHKLRLKLGTQVSWTSQAGGFAKVKTGQVVEIVPTGESPVARLKTDGYRRDHESYVVLVGRTNYWPRVSGLQVVAAKALPKRHPKRLTSCPTCHGSGMVMAE